MTFFVILTLVFAVWAFILIFAWGWIMYILWGEAEEE